MEHEYFEVDVFATTPFSGNPLAVVANAGELDTQQMQSIAAWINFSETSFLLPPTESSADYRVRIFTPFEELPFAGHPTLGSARAWRSLGIEPHKHGRIVQECALGLVTIQEEAIRNDEGVKQKIFSFATPELLKSGPLSPDELASACDALNISSDEVIDHGWGDNGPGWKILQLRDATAVKQLKPKSQQQEKVGVVGTYDGQGSAYEVRAFMFGLEDPVTGSLNGSVAQFMRERGHVPDTYTASQGSQLGRNGIIHVFDDGKEIWIGGSVHIRVAGKLTS
ncbi:phenazine biosynthesis protein PhzF [Corynebacterium stationis]|uniref:Phenazine biosynthesis protein PhzF n=1 Tax=Corynebacterium stationis TaxID=1705 RepID=A0A177I8F8_9CORY|nr:PhzF family phenazine biosynthesis protein [Corynebacterium stationis]OAH25083.1 phenazine biosynthesis protein PhzF [Corynebacterium stationis]